MKASNVSTLEYADAEKRYGAARLQSAASASKPYAIAAGLELTRVVVPLPNRALKVNNWRVEAGDKVALIGRNGVGKTSLTEAVLGFRNGAVVEGRMLGVEIEQWRRKPVLRKRLGVQLQRVAYPGRPRVKEVIAMHRALFDKTSEEVMTALGIRALSNQLYELLSRGETQRVDLFLALAHEPEILFLDEPFTGLDPHFAKMLAALIRSLRNTTIVMCCHTVEELSLATHIAWLMPTGIAHYGKADELRCELVGDYFLTVQCEDENSLQWIAELIVRENLTDRPLSIEGETIFVAGPEHLGELARSLVDRPGVRAVEVGRSSLADLLRYCSRGN